MTELGDRLKRLTRSAVALVPHGLKLPFLRAAALAPPAYKTHNFVRACAVLSTTLPRDTEVVTNLGIHPRLRITMPLSAGGALTFGSPSTYAGERGALALAAELAPSCDAFVDIGAHRGMFVFQVAERTAGRIPIHFFEANPALFQRLQTNVLENGLRNVHGHGRAISRDVGHATFYVQESDVLSSLVNQECAAHGAPCTVETTSFDAFARTEGIDRALVKVDVENAEELFLEGAREEHRRIEFLIIELLGPAIRAGMVRRVAALLGAHAYYINDLRLEHSPDGSFHYVAPEYNWLFCRLDPAALAERLRQTQFQVARWSD